MAHLSQEAGFKPVGVFGFSLLAPQVSLTRSSCCYVSEHRLHGIPAVELRWD
jgi:hypothetical protein